MHGDDAPLAKLEQRLQEQIDELRRELQETVRGMTTALRTIREMIEDRQAH